MCTTRLPNKLGLWKQSKFQALAPRPGPTALLLTELKKRVHNPAYPEGKSIPDFVISGLRFSVS